MDVPMMKGVMFDPEKHLEIIKGWAESIKGWVPPKEMIPPTSVVIYDDEIPCSFGSLYMDVFTPISSVNWLMVNPALDAERKAVAVHAVFTYLSMMSIDENRPIVMFYGKGGIANIARKHGFEVADREILLTVKPVSKENFHA
jgi:hypothetical protein